MNTSDMGIQYEGPAYQPHWDDDLKRIDPRFRFSWVPGLGVYKVVKVETIDGRLSEENVKFLMGEDRQYRPIDQRIINELRYMVWESLYGDAYRKAKREDQEREYRRVKADEMELQHMKDDERHRHKNRFVSSGD